MEQHQTTHTDPGLHPPLPPSTSPAICARPLPATLQQRGPNPQLKSPSITGGKREGTQKGRKGR